MLRPTFMGFDIAKRGIQVSQKGLDLTGQNMVNWDSAGYTRQRVDQVSLSQHIYTSRYSTSRVNLAGQGVDIAGVGQIRDTFLDKLYRDENAESGYFEMANGILSAVQDAIGEYQPLSNAGIRGSLEPLVKALSDFSKNPFDETNANVVSTAFKNLALTLQQLSSAIDKTAEQQKYDLEISVYEANEKIQELSNLNYTISQNIGLLLENPKYGPNELLDQQNLLLDELSRYGNIEVTRNADFTVTVTMGGQQVVDGENPQKQPERLEYVDNGNNTVSLRWVSTGDRCDFSAGRLKSYTDFINGRGPNQTNVGESPYKGILYYKDQLNIFASTLADVVNRTVPDTLNADGTVATYKTLMGAVSTVANADGTFPVVNDIPVTAGNIALSDEWSVNAAYVIAIPDSKNNEYVLALYHALYSDKQAFSGLGETFTGTFTENVDGYVATLGEDISFYAGRFEASESRLNTFQDQRDSVSGVVMDEETSNMLLYKKSFDAASRLMTTLDEALDVLINRTGLVGR